MVTERKKNPVYISWASHLEQAPPPMPEFLASFEKWRDHLGRSHVDVVAVDVAVVVVALWLWLLWLSPLSLWLLRLCLLCCGCCGCGCCGCGCCECGPRPRPRPRRQPQLQSQPQNSQSTTIYSESSSILQGTLRHCLGTGGLKNEQNQSPAITVCLRDQGLWNVVGYRDAFHCI